MERKLEFKVGYSLIGWGQIKISRDRSNLKPPKPHIPGRAWKLSCDEEARKQPRHTDAMRAPNIAKLKKMAASVTCCVILRRVEIVLVEKELGRALAGYPIRGQLHPPMEAADSIHW
jgi:hypothetical protein